MEVQGRRPEPPTGERRPQSERPANSHGNGRDAVYVNGARSVRPATGRAGASHRGTSRERCERFSSLPPPLRAESFVRNFPVTNSVTHARVIVIVCRPSYALNA